MTEITHGECKIVVTKICKESFAAGNVAEQISDPAVAYLFQIALNPRGYLFHQPDTAKEVLDVCKALLDPFKDFLCGIQVQELFDESGPAAKALLLCRPQPLITVLCIGKEAGKLKISIHEWRENKELMVLACL